MDNNRLFKGVSFYSDAIISAGVVGILIVMIIPIPKFLLDLLLSFSVTLSLIILLVSMYMLHPLDFSVFPSLLLLVTLFRLSLNVASTRLILLHGNEGVDAAGQVIKAFGGFVVGGNFVVGLVIFIILMVINFIVITKGSVRTSEVAARFTLDAIPGKQMSIDADLNAGIINDVEAKRRRKRLEEEADFYGHMDGAIRFVRGDAIAGIIITLINIIGGLIIGVIQHNMSLSESARIFTLLTIGDGLVSQMPALVVSTASGIVVTRAVSEENLGADFTKQLFFNHRALLIVGIILLFFGLIPGLPHIPFFILGALCEVAGYNILLSKRQQQDVEKQRLKKEEKKDEKPEQMESLLTIDILGLEIGYELIPLVDLEKDGELLNRIKAVRRQFALEMGLIVPPIHIKDNLQLKSNEYSFLIKGIEIARGEVMMNYYLAMDAGTAGGKIHGIETKEPTFGLTAYWINKQEKERASMLGYTVVDVATVITTHIKELIKRYAHEILTRQDVQRLIDNVKKDNAKVVEELIPAQVSVGGVQKVLQNLLKENISIRDMVTILETLSDYAVTVKDIDALTELVRQSLARIICKQYVSSKGDISVIMLDKEVEDIVSASIKKGEFGSYLAIEPTTAKELLNKIAKAMEGFLIANSPPILLSSPKSRIYLKRLTERFIPNLVVLSHNEITSDVKIRNLGVVSLTQKMQLKSS